MEHAPEIVERQAMLGTTCDRRHLECFGVERKVASVQVDRLRPFDIRADDLPPHRSRRATDPVVEAPMKAVNQPLHVRPLKAVNTFFLTSDFPSPSVSLQYQISERPR